MVRAFLAIDLPKNLKKKLSELSKIEIPDGLRLKWVEEENFHITLHFFGNLSEKLAEKILKGCEVAFKDFSPFYLEVSELGHFPEKGNPRVIWMGIKDATQTLVKLNKTLEGLLKKLKLEKRAEEFHPHITLFRIKKFESAEDFKDYYDKLKKIAKDFTGLKFPVREIILFKSELSPKGPKYTPIGKISLEKSYEGTAR